MVERWQNIFYNHDDACHYLGFYRYIISVVRNVLCIDELTSQPMMATIMVENWQRILENQDVGCCYRGF